MLNNFRRTNPTYADNIYFNASIFNPNHEPKVARYSETRNVSYISNANLYN